MTNRPQPQTLCCPACGRDHFVLITYPHSGSAPFWWCRQCRHVRPSNEHTILPVRPALTPAQQSQAQSGYAGVAQWCAEQLWSAAGRDALAYLHERGFSDETIKRAGWGYHPDRAEGAGSHLFHTNTEAYHGAQLGGVHGPQGRVKSLLRHVITIPYMNNGTTTLLRTRKLDPNAPVKYLAPAGVTFYAGSTPTLYGHDVLSHTANVILTEGEFKAELATQYWYEKRLSMPAVGQPGIGYLPESYIRALANKTVYLVYDREARKDALRLSPGEQFTIWNGEKLTGAKLETTLLKLQSQRKAAKKSHDIQAELDAENAIIQTLQALNAIKEHHISVKVVRLPRRHDQTKVDLDDFLLTHGAAALQTLLDTAVDFAVWYRQHGATPYRLEHGGIWNGVELGNYQAIITENITFDDGIAPTTVHRIAAQSPSGVRTTIDVQGEAWADTKKAMQVLRVGLHDGAWRDRGAEMFDAIKHMSQLGDGALNRTIPTATGWIEREGHWAYVMPDGAITATGIDRSVRCEIPASASGNHYALCGDGDAEQGWAAMRAFLHGSVCDHAEALTLIGQAALAVVHRFSGDDGRPALWLDGETGSHKTSLVRIALALFGPRFTAERADGASLPKWDTTANALELLAFTYRDTLFCLDDYKLATAGKGTAARFLHNYSEGSSRGRMTKDRQYDRTYPARGIAIITGEDRPTGDTGQLGRTILYPHPKGSVNTSALQTIQAAGAAGHLAAWWRGFLQSLAQTLDNHGVAAFRSAMQTLRQQDDTDFGEMHARATGGFRQNRAAFLVFIQWLVQAGYCTADEAITFRRQHARAQQRIAAVQRSAMETERPANIFLDVLREMLATREVRITDDAALDAERTLARANGEFGDPHALADLLQGHEIGFWYEDRAGNRYAALFPEKAFEFVQKRRSWQRQPIEYSKAAIGAQLASDKFLAKTDKDRTDKQLWRNDMRVRAWVFHEHVFGGNDPDADDEITEPPREITEITKTPEALVINFMASPRPKTDEITRSPTSPRENTTQEEYEKASAINQNILGDLGDLGDLGLSSLSHQQNEITNPDETLVISADTLVISLSPQSSDDEVRHAAIHLADVGRVSDAYAVVDWAKQHRSKICHALVLRRVNEQVTTGRHS